MCSWGGGGGMSMSTETFQNLSKTHAERVGQ